MFIYFTCTLKTNFRLRKGYISIFFFQLWFWQSGSRWIACNIKKNKKQLTSVHNMKWYHICPFLYYLNMFKLIQPLTWAKLQPTFYLLIWLSFYKAKLKNISLIGRWPTIYKETRQCPAKTEDHFQIHLVPKFGRTRWKHKLDLLPSITF